MQRKRDVIAPPDALLAHLSATLLGSVPTGITISMNCIAISATGSTVTFQSPPLP